MEKVKQITEEKKPIPEEEEEELLPFSLGKLQAVGDILIWLPLNGEAALLTTTPYYLGHLILDLVEEAKKDIEKISKGEDPFIRE